MFRSMFAGVRWSTGAFVFAVLLGMAVVFSASMAGAQESLTPASDAAAETTPAERVGLDVPTPSETVADIAKTVGDTAEAQGMSATQIISYLAIVLLVFVLPVVLGNYFARVFRMPDHGWKIGLVLFATIAGIVICVLGWPPKRGIDLSGGVILIYEIDQERNEGQDFDMSELASAINRRINPDGLKETVVRPFGANQIEIIIPEADQSELERYKQIISQQGALEFRIVANRYDHEDIQRLASQPEFEHARNVYDGDRLVAQWLPVRRGAEDSFSDPAFATRVNRRGELEVLLVHDDFNVTGQYLTNARAGVDNFGGPAVNFSFNASGANLFGALTGANLPVDTGAGGQRFRHLAIILDGEVYSAPRLNSKITDSGQITGRFTPEEVDDLASVLNAGKLPAVLNKEPSSSLLIGPTLGADTIRSGVQAMVVSTVAVAIFMLVYYRFAGIAANFALFLNVLLIVAFMILLKAPFTLAGLAGLALTVGMAVDANVLIYERMREERAKGATLRMAIRNGFDRAMRAIVDANVTTLITAVVLYVIGSDQIKGFAVTLILGLVMNLFTAVFCTRVLFDIAEHQRWIKDLKMMQMWKATNINFLGARHAAIAISLALIAIGFVGVFFRGQGILDIDFTGGTSVELLFREPQEIEVVRQKLEARNDVLTDLTVNQLKSAQTEQFGLRYVINTSQPQVAEVEQTLIEIFGDALAYNHVTIADVQPIGGEAPAASAPASEQSSAPRHRRAAGADEMLLALATQAEDGDAAPAEPATDATDTAAPEAAAPATDEAEAADNAAPETATPEGTESAPEAESETPPATDAPVGPATPAPAPVGPTAPPPSDATTSEQPAPSEPSATGRRDLFDGGTSANLTFEFNVRHVVLEESLRNAIESIVGREVPFEITNPDYQPGSETPYGSWTVRLAMPPEEAKPVLDAVAAEFAREAHFPSSNTIGSTVAGRTQQQAIFAMVASLLLIVIYLWFRFAQVMFGVAAVVAVIHDVLVTIGALAVSYWLAPYLGWALVEPFKISLSVVAALLTIVGFSLNDTIVIFDRIREIRGKSPDLTPELINKAVNETLSRTILTSLTVFLVVLILYIWGGSSIHAFSFALVVGVVAGAFSTIYIASPVLIWMQRWTEAPANTGSRQRSKVTAAS